MNCSHCHHAEIITRDDNLKQRFIKESIAPCYFNVYQQLDDAGEEVTVYHAKYMLKED